jgi:hypothetical protein
MKTEISEVDTAMRRIVVSWKCSVLRITDVGEPLLSLNSTQYLRSLETEMSNIAANLVFTQKIFCEQINSYPQTFKKL